MASHELKAPLSLVLGGIDMVLGGVLGDISDKQRTWLERAGGNARKLCHLANNILDFRKLESGKMQFIIECLIGK